ncbi:MAG: NAD+ synthase, partial [Alphaproteobacteria bacterium]|nr:NAD+ synthase [Alphaproteobacteria bacterium]
MTERLTIALAQCNPIVGDIDGNIRLISDAYKASAGADLVIFSELVVSGYPPEDLVLKPFFQDKVEAAVRALAKQTNGGGPAMLVPTPWREDGNLYNAVLLLDDGEIAAQRFKCDLPNYGVFDEKRIFTPGPMPGPINFRDVRIGVPICEDIWTPDVTECLGESGAEILLVPNGSPFEIDKRDDRQMHAVARVTETGLPLVYLNQVGGQDELVFDGSSFVLNADCSLALQAPSWREALMMTEWTRDAAGIWHCAPGEIVPPSEGLEAMYGAMMLGLRDYVRKNGFPGIVLGLSGGIDSALSAAVAVDALGADNVQAVMMPSPYTSQESLEDAEAAAKLMGIRYDTVGIEPAMKAFEAMLKPIFGNRPPDITEENIQARSRGLLLMSISNKFGSMLLTTGNKSEMAVGYATLYGDMSGGYSVLKDIYKTDVFRLSTWRNQHRPDGALGPGGRVIPERIITKPPSAELKPD